MTRPSPAVGALLAGSVSLVLGCASLGPVSSANNVVTAELRDAQGRPVGTATFSEVRGGVRVVLEMRGMPPGTKGVHIHETGRCEPPDFGSAGAHLNPDGQRHGLLNAAGPHAGDLPNITIGSNGVGRLETMNDRVTLRTRAALLDADGSALVVHAMPDDFTSDPAGGSGARVACGVIVTSPAGPEPPPPSTPARPAS